MKKLCLLFVCTWMCLTMLDAQSWVELTTPIGGNIFATHRQGANIYGTLTAGGFVRSTDGGATWTTIPSGVPAGTPTMLTVTSSGSILMTKMDIGGPNGSFPLYVSSDEGDSWTPVPNVSATGGSAISGPSNKVLWIPPYDGFSTLKVSGDGGMTWNTTSMVAKSAAFNSSGKIYVLHYNGGAGETQLWASGANDSTYAEVSGANIDIFSEKITIAPNNTIYVVGGSPKPKFSTDNGSSFSDMDSTYSNVWSDASNNLFATLGTNTCLRQTSGTSTWQNVSSGLGLFGISGYYFQDNGSVFVTSGGKLLKFSDDGNPTAIAPANDILQSISIYPQPATDRIHLANTDPTTLKSIVIFNLSGQPVKDVNPDLNIPVNDLPDGLYILDLVSNDGTHAFHRISVMK